MTTDFYNLLISDCILAFLLLGLFWYVGNVSRGVRGIVTWGVAHFVYSVGAAMLDGTSQQMLREDQTDTALAFAGVGGLLACAGLVGLAWSITEFVQQRRITRREFMLMPLAVGLSLAGWIFWNTTDAQGAAMSAVEVVVMAVLIWRLRELRSRPDRVPAQLMMLGCAGLTWLYARDLYNAAGGNYGPNQLWVNADLSIWFLLNFCMLMLTSFHAAESLRQSALFDPLTGALNRRGLTSELRHYGDHGDARGVAVLALDLDHFKAVNDRHGHETGDMVLQRFSDVVRSCIRNQDLFVRVGGEEFVLVLRDTRLEAAQQTAERIRSQVKALEFDTGGATFQVTVSLGVAYSERRLMPFKQLMRLADEALYEAKHNGRNRIELRLQPG